MMCLLYLIQHEVNDTRQPTRFVFRPALELRVCKWPVDEPWHREGLSF